MKNLLSLLWRGILSIGHGRSSGNAPGPRTGRSKQQQENDDWNEVGRFALKGMMGVIEQQQGIIESLNRMKR